MEDMNKVDLSNTYGEITEISKYYHDVGLACVSMDMIDYIRMKYRGNKEIDHVLKTAYLLVRDIKRDLERYAEDEEYGN